MSTQTPKTPPLDPLLSRLRRKAGLSCAAMAGLLEEAAAEIERLRFDLEQSQAHALRLYTFTMGPVDKISDEAKRCEPGNTANDAMAIDVANRTLAFEACIRKNRELRAENVALLSLLVDEGPESPTLWHALLPDKFAPLGMAWCEYETREEAEAAVRQAASEAQQKGSNIE